MSEPAEATTAEDQPHLRRVPILEVVCGILFPAVPQLDAFEFGVYWDQRWGDYPERRSRKGG